MTRQGSFAQALYGQMSNSHVRLVPLGEVDLEALRQAGNDPSIWQWMPLDGSGNSWSGFVAHVLAEAEAGRWVPFGVLTPEGRPVGMTCFLNLDDANRRVEIGSTWYAPSVQGGPINPAAKLLMLERGFSAGAVRIELKTDARNGRSRNAILKLGATEEGTLRKHMRRRDGSWRDTVYFSVLDTEWGFVMDRLDTRLAALTGSRQT